MAEVVKGKRRYDSTRRREQAAGTRRAIIDAAEELFRRDGYAATPVAAIAARAGVAQKTVYLAFESKPAVLRAVWHRALRGDEGEAPVPEREWYRAVLAEPDPARKLRRYAGEMARLRPRMAWAIEVIDRAAPHEPDIAVLWKRIRSEFHGTQRAVVESIAEGGGLREDLDVDRATDALFALNDPRLFTILVAERGWTPEDYGRWLGDVLVRELLGG